MKHPESSYDHSGASRDPDIERDLATLVQFVAIYCQHNHRDAPREAANIKGFNLGALAERPPVLCGDCTKLLHHALVKRSHCPMEPKPACKHCPSHCYHPRYRAQIREVMKQSGRKLVMSGRLDLLHRLLF
ncbi:MAG: nitrous oxide-stimulated promoter family protein [Planctomycetota bacterium]|jgi:hypothetical protein